MDQASAYKAYLKSLSPVPAAAVPVPVNVNVYVNVNVNKTDSSHLAAPQPQRSASAPPASQKKQKKSPSSRSTTPPLTLKLLSRIPAPSPARRTPSFDADLVPAALLNLDTLAFVDSIRRANESVIRNTIAEFDKMFWELELELELERGENGNENGNGNENSYSYSNSNPELSHVHKLTIISNLSKSTFLNPNVTPQYVTLLEQFLIPQFRKELDRLELYLRRNVFVPTNFDRFSEFFVYRVIARRLKALRRGEPGRRVWGIPNDREEYEECLNSSTSTSTNANTVQEIIEQLNERLMKARRKNTELRRVRWGTGVMEWIMGDFEIEQTRSENNETKRRKFDVGEGCERERD